MIRNDFIMRLIELLGVFLARVFQKIEKGDWDGAAEDIDKTSKEILGIPITIVESNQAENLITLFSSPSGPDYSRILAAAVLLDARGEVVAGAGNEISGVILWTKAATLYLESFQSPDESIRNRSLQGINSLEKKLIDFELPKSLHIRLAEFHENGGRFSLAEEHWFEGSLDSPDRKSILQSFYRRMLALPDEAIEAGDLTRAEILESREELQ